MKYIYLEDEITFLKIQSSLGVSPTSLVVGDIEIGRIDTPNGKLSLYKRGIEIEFPNDLTPSQLITLDNLLKYKNLARSVKTK